MVKTMNEQIILLFSLILGTVITLFLYLWKSKKELSYKGDERWQLIQNKALIIANYSNYILIILLAIGQIISISSDIQINFTLNRVLTYGILFITLRNTLEVFALKYFDKQM